MSAFLQASEPPRSPQETLPTMYDLPSEEPGDPGVPDEFHLFQPELLRQTFKTPCYPPEEVFVAADLNVYYDLRHLRWYKRPDWFAAVGVSRLYDGIDLRMSYVLWQERVAPTVVVELLSPGTHKEDLGENAREPEIEEEDANGWEASTPKPPGKWEVYEQIIGIPYYVVFDRYSDQLRFFRLQNGRYEEQNLKIAAPQIWISELELGLGLWQGACQGIHRLWLRWCDAQGNWIATPAEAAQQEAEAARSQAEAAQREAEAARSQAEAAQQEAEAAERARRDAIPPLLAMGLSPERVAAALGLTLEEVNRYQ